MDQKRKPVPRLDSSNSEAGPSNAAAPTTDATIAETISPEPGHDLPPSYTGPSIPTSPSSSSVPTRTTTATADVSQHGMPPVDFKAYRMPGVTLAKDKMTYTTNLVHYSQSPQALADLIQRHAKLPPHPQIRITSAKQDGSTALFDIRISMMKYFVRPADARGSAGWQYVRTINEGELGWRGGKQASVVPNVNGGLDEWISRYIMEEIKDKR